MGCNSSYKTRLFLPLKMSPSMQISPFQNSKNLDPSYKMDLNFCVVLEGRKACLITEDITKVPIYLTTWLASGPHW